MKEIFQKRIFWMIIIILLLVVFVYPPFIAKAPIGGYGQGGEVVINRSWEWIFSSPKYSGLIMEIDFKTILAESIIAILVTIGICLIPFSKASKKKD